MSSKEAKEKVEPELPCCWTFSSKQSFVHKRSRVLLWDWMQGKTEKQKNKKLDESAVLKKVFTSKNLARHPSKYQFNILNDSAKILYRCLKQFFKHD